MTTSAERKGTPGGDGPPSVLAGHTQPAQRAHGPIDGELHRLLDNLSAGIGALTLNLERQMEDPSHTEADEVGDLSEERVGDSRHDGIEGAVQDR